MGNVHLEMFDTRLTVNVHKTCDRFIPISEAHIGNENIRIGHLIVRRGDDFGPNRHFCVALTVLNVTGL